MDSRHSLQLRLQVLQAMALEHEIAVTPHVMGQHLAVVFRHRVEDAPNVG